MRIFRWLAAPLLFIWRVLWYPLRLRARRRALKKHGWLELHLEGEVTETPPTRSATQELLRRMLKREEPPRVVLARLRRMVSEVLQDPHARGVLVRVGMLGGGWAAADEIRRQLERLREAGKQVVVHVKNHAGNHEMLVALAGTRLLMTPTGAMAAVGASSTGLFLKETLERAGVKIEVASEGRFKSAPDQFTRTSRSEFDLEQARAMIEALDGELVSAIVASRGIDPQKASQMLDEAPMIGVTAKEHGYCDGVARDEDLASEVKAVAETEDPPLLLGAGTYLAMRQVKPPWRRRRRKIGIVEVHGAIVDQAPRYAELTDRVAVEKHVVNDLRAAQEDPSIGAVVLLVNSRGGSVTASDGIYSAVKRLDADKPVIACFSDVSASGGYYVACGARAIYASPLTITGSIGVFAMLPTWPQLAERLGVGHDVVKTHRHASLYNPWTGMSEEDRSHAQREVRVMYDQFIGLVADARHMTREAVHAVAEGRVWIGRDARAHGLLDGLDGMTEALERARAEVEGPLEDMPVLVHAKRDHPRPGPIEIPAAAFHPAWALLRNAPGGALAAEMLTLALTSHSRWPVFAYSPLALD